VRDQNRALDLMQGGFGDTDNLIGSTMKKMQVVIPNGIFSTMLCEFGRASSAHMTDVLALSANAASNPHFALPRRPVEEILTCAHSIRRGCITATAPCQSFICRCSVWHASWWSVEYAHTLKQRHSAHFALLFSIVFKCAVVRTAHLKCKHVFQ